MTDRVVARAHSLTPDPPARSNGGCAQCGKPRKVKLGVSKQSGSNRDALELAKLDPFCSAACCRRWHRCELPATAGGQAQSERWESELDEDAA